MPAGMYEEYISALEAELLAELEQEQQQQQMQAGHDAAHEAEILDQVAEAELAELLAGFSMESSPSSSRPSPGEDAYGSKRTTVCPVCMAGQLQLSNAVLTCTVPGCLQRRITGSQDAAALAGVPQAVEEHALELLELHAVSGCLGTAGFALSKGRQQAMLSCSECGVHDVLLV